MSACSAAGRPAGSVFVPHPNARTRRTFAANVGAEALERLQAALAEAA